MNFVESLRMFHVDAKEIPCVTGKGAPTEKTLGAPGVLYMDTDTGDLYKCRAADAVNKVYTWEKIGGGSSDYKLPIGGENLGGVKNGGNVVINEDGTMTAPVSDSSQNATLTANGKALLRALLTAAVYDSEILPDPSTTIEAFLAELDVVVPDSGGGTDEPDVPDVPDEPEKTTFTVTYNLNGVVSSNTATSATEGNGFTTVLSAGSAIDSVTVKMGGVDITETAYNSTSGMITIAKVTGDIVITAAIADPSLLYQLKDASFNGATIVDTGVSLFDEKKDFTILFDFENASCANKAPILGLVEDDTITDSYQHFYVCTDIANKNQDTETIKCYSLISKSELIDFPSQPSDADNREYSAKLAVTFDSTRDKWTAKVLNIKTGETAENTLTKSVTTMPNTVAIGGSSYRGKASFTCNEFSIYNRVLSADEISAWMQ